MTKGEQGLWDFGLLCVCAPCNAASKLQPSQIQAQPHSYLFHKLRSKCRCWQIRPGSGAALLQQLLSRNSPSMPCWGWGKELKDSWAGCVINSLHDWCPTWLIMSQLKRRQEKGKYFQTHHFLLIFTLPDRQRESSQPVSLLRLFHSCVVSSPGLVWHMGQESFNEIIDMIFGSRHGSQGGLAATVDSSCISATNSRSFSFV